LKVSLEMSEERFRLLVSSVQDYAILMLDPEGHVISWNDGARRSYGYDAAEIMGQHFSRFYIPEEGRGGKPGRELDAAARDGRAQDEGWRVRSDGSRFWADVTITSLHDREARLLGFVEVVRDVTERMQAHRALERTNQELASEIKKKTEAQGRLQESENSLRGLSLDLLGVQDEERRRIGRELHDSVGQSLAMLKVKLEVLRTSSQAAEPRGRKRLGRELEECDRLVDDSIHDTRTVAYLLYPPMLDEMGLTHAVTWFVDGFARRSGIEITSELADGFPRLAPETELVIYRILQESLTNVHRHSGSRTAHVRLGVSDGAVVLEVADSGRGLGSSGSGEPGKWGVGLRGMHERVQHLGGRLELTSRNGGTTVIASLPLVSGDDGATSRDQGQ
jgi:PAS domain S-box-containing protein